MLDDEQDIVEHHNNAENKFDGVEHHISSKYFFKGYL